MAILTEEALEGFKQHTNRTIAYARYKIDGNYTRVEISRRERLKDGRVAVYFHIDAQGQTDVTISEVQLFDTNNDLWATKEENILVRGVQEGVLYRFTFDFKEV